MALSVCVTQSVTARVVCLLCHVAGARPADATFAQIAVLITQLLIGHRRRCKVTP